MQPEGQAILTAVFTLVTLCVIIIMLFMIFLRRKNALLLEKKDAEKQFEHEIAKTQIEIREETFRNISWELHDNIGQLITLAKIQLQNASDLSEVKETLDKSLKELRVLSKLVNPEAINSMTLIEAIEQEIARFNRLNFIKSTLEIKGKPVSLDKKVELIFFRILQEFFSNTVKYSKATHLHIELDFKENGLTIIAKDNGQGFDTNKAHSGIGLSNIKNRAKLVHAKASISSELDKGTQLTLKYNFQNG